jgi:hypothetical protein
MWEMKPLLHFGGLFGGPQCDQLPHAAKAQIESSYFRASLFPKYGWRLASVRLWTILHRELGVRLTNFYRYFFCWTCQHKNAMNYSDQASIIKGPLTK